MGVATTASASASSAALVLSRSNPYSVNCKNVVVFLPIPFPPSESAACRNIFISCFPYTDKKHTSTSPTTTRRRKWIRPFSPVMELQDSTQSVLNILDDKPDLSRWSLKYSAFGSDIEFYWLARNMQPIKNPKIHWRSVEGLPNRGTVRFFHKGDSACVVEALQPFLESLLLRGLERFATFTKSYAAGSAS